MNDFDWGAFTLGVLSLPLGLTAFVVTAEMIYRSGRGRNEDDD